MVTDESPQSQEITRTPGLAHSPKGQFDAQTALRALEAEDEDGLIATLATVKWGKTGYQAMTTIEEALGPGTEALYEWACRLAQRPEPVARAIAAPLFRHYWPSWPDEVQTQLLQFADFLDRPARGGGLYRLGVQLPSRIRRYDH